MNQDLPISNLQLISDRIVKMSYEVDIKNIVNKELKPYVKLQLSKKFFADDKLNARKAILDLEINFQLKEGRKTDLKLNVVIQGEFIGNQKLEEEKFKELVIKSGVINLLTIARSKIVAMSSLFGFTSPIYIPFLNIKKFIDKELKEIMNESKK